MARNRSAGQEPTDLAKLIDNTLLLLEREMNKYRVVIDKSFQPIPEAYVNGNQIQQVFLNLLINARQAMPSGGRIAIKLLHDGENDMVDLVAARQYLLAGISSRATQHEGEVVVEFGVELPDLFELPDLLAKLENVPGVVAVTRR